MFMVSEAETGYICGFDVYTGKDSNPDDAGCAKMTSTVMDLLDSIKLLNKGCHVYFDNYYNSPELIEKLLERKTHVCGTVRKDCWGLPKALSKAKLTKRGQTVFCRKCNLLALKWKGKRDVYILSGIHKADSVVSLKRTYKGEK